MRIFEVVLLAGLQMRVGLSTTAIFGDLSGYFFGNFRGEGQQYYGDTLPLVGL